MVIFMPTMVVKEEDGNGNGGEIGRLWKGKTLCSRANALLTPATRQNNLQSKVKVLVGDVDECGLINRCHALGLAAD